MGQKSPGLCFLVPPGPTRLAPARGQKSPGLAAAHPPVGTYLVWLRAYRCSDQALVVNNDVWSS